MLLHRYCERLTFFEGISWIFGRIWQVWECIWSSQNRVNRKIWEAAVPIEFGSVSVRVKNVRDVLAGKMCAVVFLSFCTVIVNVSRFLEDFRGFGGI